MRHLKKVKKLGLKKEHRTSLLRNLVTSLVLNGHIKTTPNRAKALASKFGRMMTLVKKKEKREAIRLLPQYLSTNAASMKVVDELKAKYADRTSGFTRIIPVGLRKGDSAPQVHIELI